MEMTRIKSSPELCSSTDCSTTRLKLEEVANSNGTLSSLNILDFSDEVLLYILKYLRQKDLLPISLCSKKFSRLARDQTLWRKMVIREETCSDLEKYVEFLQVTLMFLLIECRTCPYHSSHLRPFLNAVKARCGQLNEVIIGGISILEIRLTDLPCTIETLSLIDCDMINYAGKPSHFLNMDQHMPNLTRLILTGCKYFSSNNLLDISKIPKLKELQLGWCVNLGSYDVSAEHISRATKNGFKALEILNVEHTGLGDNEVSFLINIETLTHLYLEDNHFRLQGYIGNNYRRLGQRPPESGICQPVTNRAICALGREVRKIFFVPPNTIRYQDRQISNDSNLEVLSVRDCPNVTDASLAHLALYAPRLKYLNVTETSITKHGIKLFKSQRTNVEVVSSYDET